MKNEMKRLTEILFEGKLTRNIYNDTATIDALAKRFNTLLDIRPNTIDELKTTHISETVISPKVFAAMGDKKLFDFVFISLSPDFHDIQIRLEKQQTGVNWSTYYDFYTSNKYFDYVNEQKPNHYTNVNKLLYTLYKEHESHEITIEAIQKQLGVEKADIFKTLVEDKSILFPQIVPFHSKGFSTNMNGINHLRENIVGYDQYIDALFDYINNYTEDNGVIITTGFSEARIVRTLLEEKNAVMLIENQLISIQKWHNKIAVLFNDQLFSRHGLRSDTEIDTVMLKVRSLIENYSENTVVELKDYCKRLLEERAEEEHLMRGQRINGTKLKKLAVKKIRKDKPAPVRENSESSK